MKRGGNTIPDEKDYDIYELDFDDGSRARIGGVGSANNLIKEKESSLVRINYIIQDVFGTETRVDLKTGSIKVNDKKIDPDIPEKQLKELKGSGFRWINFNRGEVTYSMGSGCRTDFKTYYIGWQSNLKDGTNVKRLIGVGSDRKWKLVKTI